eukprot:g8783.t1
MSLFSTHELWSATVSSNEEFGQRALCVGNIDNESGGFSKIVTGSFQGVLRIYYPRGGEYRIEDLMVEQFLHAPILQLGIGNFIPASNLLALAVLHPRQLVVYQIAAMGGTGKSASYYSVVEAYSHILNNVDSQFSAGNMIWGSFGLPDKRKHSICVQSMDGRLQFYEQDHYTFTTTLSDCLTPGPICYCEALDSLVTCNSKFEIVAYKYRVLASSSSKKHACREVDWSVNIGEYALDIFVCRYATRGKTNDILILGEHSMFCISEQGVVTMQKRLDYSISACSTYNRRVMGGKGIPSSRIPENLIVATRSKRLLIYRDDQLIWAAKNTYVPVSIGVGSFGGVDGTILTLTAEGRLSLIYLGADAPTASVVGFPRKTMDYREIDEEYRTLLKDIRSKHKENLIEPPAHILTIRSQVPEVLDTISDEESIALRDRSCLSKIAIGKNRKFRRVTTRLFVASYGKCKIKNVNISVSPSSSIFVEDSVIRIRQLKGGGTPLILSLSFYSTADCTPSSRNVSICASFIIDNEARACYHELILPLAMFASPIAPLKAYDYKFTIETDKHPIQVSDLFSSFIKHSMTPQWILEKYLSQTANVLSIQYSNGETATVLVSKNSGKYRIQGSSFPALCLLTVEVIHRLEQTFADKSQGISFAFCNDFEYKNKNGPTKVIETSVFAHYWKMVEKHFFCRQKCFELEAVLNRHAQQFRAIQKRLLVRFKDKNPQPLNNLDSILHQTYNQLTKCVYTLDDERIKLDMYSANLSCCTELVIIILSSTCALDSKSLEILKSHLTPVVGNASIQGWEECVDSALTQLLRTALAKSEKDFSTVPLPITFPQNTAKFKRHFDIVSGNRDRMGFCPGISRAGAAHANTRQIARGGRCLNNCTKGGKYALHSAVQNVLAKALNGQNLKAVIVEAHPFATESTRTDISISSAEKPGEILYCR